MQVTLSDPIIEVQGWTPDLDALGAYTLKQRKSPEQLREERQAKRNMYGDGAFKVNPIESIPQTCIYKDKDKPGVAYFLPGLWPRVKKHLDTHGLQYTIVDKRNPDIRPPLDMSAFRGVTFRETQDTAVALIATSDCGIIETTTGWGKCQHGDTPIIMYDGRIKKARDIVVGDVLMGDDSTPRHVLSITRGFGPMYRYTPVKGQSYIFNDKHVLSLVQCQGRNAVGVLGRKYREGDIVDIGIEDYLKLNKTQKHLLKAYHAGAIDFPRREPPELDPYFVGLYLGDGSAATAMLTKPDEEILSYCEAYAETMGWHTYRKRFKNRCPSIVFTNGNRPHRRLQAPIVALRRACGMSVHGNEKHITAAYKYGSRLTRLKLLAGILDTDGTLNGKCVFEVCTKWDGLAEDIMFVARSLGFMACDNHCEKTCCNTGAKGMYHRITIFGHTDRIPTRLPRKQASPRSQRKDALHTGFTLERVEDGEYFGFALDGNHRYLLGDFTVTHNSQILSWMCKAYPTLNIVVTTSSTQVVATLYQYLCQIIPGEVGVLYGGKDTTAGKRVVCTTLKSLPNIPPEKVQLVFVDECHAVGANEAGKALMKFCWARRFGFSASPIRNDGTGKAMEALLGPVILKMSYQEATDAGMVTPMKYLMLPCNGCPPAAKNQDIPEVTLKRLSYWCNLSRNQAIRRFVYDLKARYDGQILIMVSTLQHAIQLHMLLPWFKVAYYGQADFNDLAKKFPKDRYPNLDLSKYKMSAKQLDIMRNAFGKGTLRYAIATKTWKQGCNFPHLQVLIRADGDVSGVEGIQIPGRLSRLDSGKDYAYLVDVSDTFSPWAHNRAMAREKLYRSQQWEPIAYQELIDELGGTEADGAAADGAVQPG